MDTVIPCVCHYVIWNISPTKMARPPSTRGSPVPAVGGEASQECGKGRAKRLANPLAKALAHRADDKQAKILKARYHYTAQAGQGRPISGPAYGLTYDDLRQRPRDRIGSRGRHLA